MSVTKLADRVNSWIRTVPMLNLREARALAIADQLVEEDHLVALEAQKSGNYLESNQVSQENSEILQNLGGTAAFRSARNFLSGRERRI